MSCSLVYFFCFFFFNDTATTEIYTLSLHDALPISSQTACQGDGAALQALRRPRRPHLQGVGEARRLRGVEAGPDHGAGGDHGRGEGIGAAGARRGGLPDGAQVVVHAEREEETPLPVRERGRV